MQNDSFDPRQWRKPADGLATAASAAAGASDAASSALPEFFRDAAAGIAAAPPPAQAAAKADGPAKSPPAPTRSTPRIGPAPAAWALSAAIVLATAGAAWFTAAPPASAPGAPQEIAADTIVERAFNLGGLGELFTALVSTGVPEDEASAAAQAAAEASNSAGEISAILVMRPDESGAMHLDLLRVTYADGSGAVVQRGTSGAYAATPVAASLSRQVKVLRGELDSESFYTSAVAAGLIDALIPEFINAFSYDFNLAAEVSPGDTFEVAFEQTVNGQGQPIGQPQLLFASLTTPAKSLALYRFRQPDGEIGWFDGNGAITKRGLMRTPVDGARITSKFGPRFHPTLHYTRLHGGTDFAAPVGTPVYAAADGVISSASPSGCAGNMVIMRHDNGWETRYFHLSRYAPGITAGTRVTQGSTIGDVGNTGTCTTGPHLHYEVHIDGEKVDPLSIPADDSTRKRMDGSALQAFMRERDRIDSARAQQAM